MQTDQELLKQIELKNSHALELLYDRYETSLYLLLRRVTTDEARIQRTLAHIFKAVWTEPRRHTSIHGYVMAAIKHVQHPTQPVH